MRTGEKSTVPWTPGACGGAGTVGSKSLRKEKKKLQFCAAVWSCLNFTVNYDRDDDHTSQPNSPPAAGKPSQRRVTSESLTIFGDIPRWYDVIINVQQADQTSNNTDACHVLKDFGLFLRYLPRFSAILRITRTRENFGF